MFLDSKYFIKLLAHSVILYHAKKRFILGPIKHGIIAFDFRVRD